VKEKTVILCGLSRWRGVAAGRGALGGTPERAAQIGR